MSPLRYQLQPCGGTCRNWRPGSFLDVSMVFTMQFCIRMRFAVNWCNWHEINQPSGRSQFRKCGFFFCDSHLRKCDSTFRCQCVSLLSFQSMSRGTVIRVQVAQITRRSPSLLMSKTAPSHGSNVSAVRGSKPGGPSRLGSHLRKCDLATNWDPIVYHAKETYRPLRLRIDPLPIGRQTDVRSLLSLRRLPAGDGQRVRAQRNYRDRCNQAFAQQICGGTGPAGFGQSHRALDEARLLPPLETECRDRNA